LKNFDVHHGGGRAVFKGGEPAIRWRKEETRIERAGRESAIKRILSDRREGGKRKTSSHD